MAGEISCDTTAGATIYFQVRERLSGGLIWASGVWQAYAAASGNQFLYANSMTQQGGSTHYVGNAPAGLNTGTFDVTAKLKSNAWFAENDQVVANGQLEYNSVIAVPLANLATSGQVATLAPIRIARGTMVQNFPMQFKSSADHITNFTSGVISGQISKDGGAFAALQSGAFLEVGLGWYSLQALTSGDTLANTIALVFTATGISGGTGDPVNIAFVTQRTSGQ